MIEIGKRKKKRIVKRSSPVRWQSRSRKRERRRKDTDRSRNLFLL